MGRLQLLAGTQRGLSAKLEKRYWAQTFNRSSSRENRQKVIYSYCNEMTDWWDRIIPDCCEECGNYKTFIGSTEQERPQNIRCWKNQTGDCRHNPNKASYAQLRKRSRLIRNPEVGKECSICLNPMNGAYVKQISCGHTFHYKCLKKWEDKKMSCPMCRHEYGEGPSIAELLEEHEEAIQNFKSDFCFFKFLIQSDSNDDELNDAFNDLSETFYDVVGTHLAYYNRTRIIHPKYKRTINRYFWAVDQVEIPISSD